MSSSPSAGSGASLPADTLGDFRTDRRVLWLALLAIPIGVISAFVAKGLLWLIALVTNLAFHQRWSGAEATPQGHTLGALVIIIPVIGALIIGLMARYGSPRIRGHGIPEALEAILLGRSLIQPKVAVLKPLSSAISIGTGGPFGAEGPIIMTGGAFGSLFAQCFHLTAVERKTLLVAGAAAGMTAIFATPVAAVLLAVELLLFEWKPRSLIPVAVAALLSSLVRAPLLGAGPVFPLPPHPTLGGASYAEALAVGLVAGLGSGLFTWMVYRCEDAFALLPVHWMWWPAIGAVAVGVGGWIEPRVLGVGYETIRALLEGHVVGVALLSLVVAKSLVWSIALGSGTSGGVLAPLLMLGGALGAACGGWLPGGDPVLGALVGMAAMMGGTLRAPLTGAVFMIELTHDFQALPVLLVGTVAALAVTVLLMRRSILTEKLARRGQHIAYEYSVDPFELVRVGEVMDRDWPAVPADTPIGEIAAGITRGDPEMSRRRALLVTDAGGELVGVLTRGDLVRAVQEDPSGAMTARAAARRSPVVIFPGATLREALDLMLRHEIGRLPVCAAPGDTRVVGYLGRAEILAGRRKHQQEEEQRERPGSLRARGVNTP